MQTSAEKRPRIAEISLSTWKSGQGIENRQIFIDGLKWPFLRIYQGKS